MIVAYVGQPGSRYFARATFENMDHARSIIWEDGRFYDLHDTEDVVTANDMAWARDMVEYAKGRMIHAIHDPGEQLELAL